MKRLLIAAVVAGVAAFALRSLARGGYKMHDHCRAMMRDHCADMFAGRELQCEKEEPATPCA